MTRKQKGKNKNQLHCSETNAKDHSVTGEISTLSTLFSAAVAQVQAATPAPLPTVSAGRRRKEKVQSDNVFRLLLCS